MRFYRQLKGGEYARFHKADRLKFLTKEEVQKILSAVIHANVRRMRRDHCALYLGFHLGLRVGEVQMITRDTFRDTALGSIYVQREKSIKRIPYHCASCGRNRRVAAVRIGTQFECGHCGTANTVKKPNRPVDPNPPEKTINAIEPEVFRYIKNYIDTLDKDQYYLISSNSGLPLSRSMLCRIFYTYLDLAGLPDDYSWHSLRHGRGVYVWERTHDLAAVKTALGQSSITAAEFYTHLSPEAQREAQNKLSRESIAENPFEERLANVR